MSTDALRAEVKANLPISLAIKAADSKYSYSNRTYTAIPTEVTHKGGHGGRGGGRNRRNSHHNSHNNNSNPVREAIDEAKRALDDVRGKGGRSKQNSRSRNRRSTSGDTEVNQLRTEVTELRQEQDGLRKELNELRSLVQQLTGVKISAPAAAEKKEVANTSKAAAKDDDFDLFGSDEEEDAAQAKVREERLAAYAAKKATKPGVIAKSSVILDVKPWDDETDLKELESLVRGIDQDGLLWGASKLIPVGYGIQKLQIVSTIEDAKVSVEDLIEKIQDDFTDHVQSVDIVAFNKI